MAEVAVVAALRMDNSLYGLTLYIAITVVSILVVAQLLSDMTLGCF